MDGYAPETYGERIAAVYDELHGPSQAANSAVKFLTDLAGAGRALELAIGTGRIALPLAERGVPVDGIDISPAMVERLRAKPGGDAIAVTIGDFADVAVSGTYRLVYVVFNTFFALLSQERQCECFANVAEHLEPDGSFVIEAFVPDLGRFRNNGSVSAVSAGVDTVRLDVSRHDPLGQRVDATHVHIGPGGIELFPVSLRYAWPAELDLMAQLAGLRLRERWDSWDRQPFTTTTPMAISVYGVMSEAGRRSGRDGCRRRTRHATRRGPPVVSPPVGVRYQAGESGRAGIE
jgi:SAM-dependent methyltransferase